MLVFKAWVQTCCLALAPRDRKLGSAQAANVSCFTFYTVYIRMLYGKAYMCALLKFLRATNIHGKFCSPALRERRWFILNNYKDKCAKDQIFPLKKESCN